MGYDNMTKILLVRHGQTTANLSEIFAGYTNAQLLKQGYQQAKLTAKFIVENYKVDKVYSSDLDRAYETGKAVADLLHMDVIREKGIREINGGDWEGVKFVTLAEKYPEAFKIWLTDLKNARCTRGESVEELAERVMATLKRIAEENEGKTVVVVSHGTPIRVVQCLAQKGDLQGLTDIPWASNASVTELEYQEGLWKCIAASMDEHLGELVTALPETV